MGEQLTLPLAPRAHTLVVDAPRAAPRRPSHARSRRRALEERLAQLCEEPVRVIVNDNRSTMLTGRRRRGLLTIRMHHMFMDADERVLRAVARFAARADRRAKLVVDEFIESHGHLITRPPRRAARGPVGEHHDLAEIFDALNARYFDGEINAEIAFGEAGHPLRRRRRSIKLGSYDDSARCIVIHPALDQAAVPRNYVEYIVFHEMLHQRMPPERRGGALRFHNAAFRRAERAFAGRREAERWYEHNADRLLRYKES